MSAPVALDALPQWPTPRLQSSPVTSSYSIQAPRNPACAPDNVPLIAFCHLGWDGVWQRPQQLLSRLSARRPVLFVETYCSDVALSEARVRDAQGFPSVTLLEMHLPAARWGDGAFIDLERRLLLGDYCRTTDRFDLPVLWFNDPMAVTAFAGHCGEQAIVYDCMDELSQFQGAPPELEERERALLAQADVVFCGGRKMRDKRLPLNANSHFYGTGVDCNHFAQALDPETPVDPEIAALPGKVLGYFGVIDERIDYALLAVLADALPDCTIAMVGPVAKVDPAAFPQRPNLRWLGRRAYTELPAITKGFAVCLMPFARNAATEYINPTKALEYMAAGRPVVSTALDEVKTNFNGVCRIADNTEEFVEWCRREVDSPSRARIRSGLKLARENTWERITGHMHAHVNEAIATRTRARAPAASPATAMAGRILLHV